MATITKVDDHGLETIRKAGFIPDDSTPTLYSIRTTITDPSGKQIEVNDKRQLKVVLDGAVDDNNTTTTALGAGETFTGTATETLDYALIFVTVYTDQESATDGLCIQVSMDGITWRDSDCYTIPANTLKTFSFQPIRRYYRVRYINGATPQTVMELDALIKKTNSKPSSHRISDSIITEDDATLVKAVLTGSNPAGTFVNFQATTAGNFKVSLEELENAISTNSNSQLKTTSYDSSGNEGQTIIGTDYVAGKSGIDSASEALQTITYEHSNIHQGDHFLYSDFVDLAINNVFDLQIITPNTTKWIHATAMIYTEAETQYILYENVNIITPGTLLTTYNNNRNSSNTAGVVLRGITNGSVALANADTAVAGANIILRGISGSGRASGFVEREKEIILKQNTSYSFRVVATSAGYCNFVLNWYEHTNLN